MSVSVVKVLNPVAGSAHFQKAGSTRKLHGAPEPNRTIGILSGLVLEALEFHAVTLQSPSRQGPRDPLADNIHTTAFSTHLDIHMIVTDGHGRHDLQLAPRGVDHLFIDLIRQHAQQPVRRVLS